jgi:hypothetical protein
MVKTVSAYPDAIADVFQKVLLICDVSGLIGKQHFAIDGCKLPSDASQEWSESLLRQSLLEHYTDRQGKNNRWSVLSGNFDQFSKKASVNLS